MRLVGYARCSTLELRFDDTNKLDLQETAIRKWARRNQNDIVAVLSDTRTSGATTALERPGLTEALELIDSGAADGLIVRDLDRLARSVTVQEAVLAMVWTKPERKVFTTTGEVLRDDPDDPYRTAMRQMAAVFTELERRMIAKRLRDGRLAKKARGGHAVGPAPYGYRTADGRLTEVPAEQTALVLMRRMRRDGATTRDIATALNDAGHPTQRGGTWSSATVSRILARAPRSATP